MNTNARDLLFIHTYCSSKLKPSLVENLGENASNVAILKVVQTRLTSVIFVADRKIMFEFSICILENELGRSVMMWQHHYQESKVPISN